MTFSIARRGAARRIAGLAALAVAAAASAQPAPPATLVQYKALALSPDGRRVASIDNAANADSAVPETHAAVIVRDAATGAVLARFDPCATCGYAGSAWSPDGRSLAFVASDSATGTATVMIGEGKAARTVATVHGTAQTPRWSPDGGTIALLVVAGAHKAIGAVEAGRPQVGEIGEADDEQRIALVPAAGGAPRFVSPADTWVYEYDWTPDGRGFVATAAKGNGDNNWWVAKLVAVDAAAATMRTIAAPALQMDAPRVSPDGTTVLFIGGLMSDFGATGGDLYAVPFAGGTPVDVTPGMKATVTSLTWRGAAPVVTRQIAERYEIARVDLTGKTARMVPLWGGPVAGTAEDADVTVAAGGSAVASVIGDFTHPDEIHVGVVAGGSADLRPITTGNAGHPAFVTARSVTWTSEGRSVQGWLLTPLAPVAGKRAMIVDIHGGPSSFAAPTYLWNGVDRTLIDHGYAVFKPNPRGSYGQGEAFTRANIRDFGGGDLRDIQAGVDEVLKTAAVDGERLGVFGHSYGGFMAMWTVTHTARFKAAVAGAGIANWISYYGQNGIDQWMIPFFGASAYDDPEVYRRDSPLTTIKAAKTPTLIYVGERDVECPAAQSVEFWHGLKAMGVPTSLIIYEGAGHRLRKPEQVHDREDRTVAWFDKWLKKG